MATRIPLGGRITETVFCKGTIRYNVVLKNKTPRTVPASARKQQEHYGRRD